MSIKKSRFLTDVNKIIFSKMYGYINFFIILRAEILFNYPLFTRKGKKKIIGNIIIVTEKPIIFYNNLFIKKLTTFKKQMSINIQKS